MKAINFIVRWSLVAVCLFFGLLILAIACMVRFWKSQHATSHTLPANGVPATHEVGRGVALCLDRVRFDGTHNQWLTIEKEQIK